MVPYQLPGKLKWFQVLPRALAPKLQGTYLGNMPHSRELMSRKGLGEAYQNSFFSQTVLIFNEFSTADENFLSSSVNRSFNKDAGAEANDLCTWL